MKKTTKNISVSFFLTLCALLLTGCYDAIWNQHFGKDNTDNKTLLSIVSEKPELSVYYAMLKKTGYAALLENPNGYTVFAPENSAWIGIDTSNVENMTRLIGLTVTYKMYFTDNEALYTKLKCLNGKNIYYDNATETFNGAKLTTVDIPAANGVLHLTDKLMTRKENIWDYLLTKTDLKQVDFIKSLNKKVMDTDKSVAIGVYPDGKTKYDTVWTNVNSFLNSYPIDNEDSVYTYVLVQNSGFDILYNKYKPYFRLSTELKTDSTTRFNVCQDFVFKGNIDISAIDTLENIDGVKIPLKGVTITETYSASNGKIYVINQSNVRLKDKIKPIKIEGENYSTSSNSGFIFTRYKRWASGERDIALASSETQKDTLWRKIPLLTGDIARKDSVVEKSYMLNANVIANVANFYIEYKAKVNSANYDVYYVAFDDIADHFDPSYKSFGVYKVTQKLFTSMPGSPKLSRGTVTSTAEVNNNYLGNTTCFVGVTNAGTHELTKLKKWSLIETTQLINAPLTAPDADIMVVPQTGNLTLWLCNTARSNASSKQGLLFLDYILLVPRISE